MTKRKKPADAVQHVCPKTTQADVVSRADLSPVAKLVLLSWMTEVLNTPDFRVRLRPNELGAQIGTPIEEVIYGMFELVQQDVVRFVHSPAWSGVELPVTLVPNVPCDLCAGGSA